MKFKLNTLSQIGAFHGDPALLDTMVASVSIDSRTIEAGQLYIALAGENHDGHDFIADSLARGAVACVVNQSFWTQRRSDFYGRPIVVVEDTLHALQVLSNMLRRELSLPVIALTGTNGKTTTKEMLAAVLSTKGSVCKTPGNYNNHIGVPLTLFALTPEHDFAVVEMGTNHFGEIAKLCTIAEPKFGLITNIGHGHTEHLQNIAGVTKAKMELFDYLHADGLIFANMDDPNIARTATRFAKKITYGFDSQAKVRGTRQGVDQNGRVSFTVAGSEFKPNLTGAHNFINGLAAVAVGLEFGVPVTDIKAGLQNIQLPSKRMEVLKVAGMTILNDAYNANPESTLAALNTLEQINSTGRKWLVLGDMLELGPEAAGMHAELGSALAKYEIAGLFAYGPLSESAVKAAKAELEVACHFQEKATLASSLVSHSDTGDVILIKGSRGMQMEDVLLYLKKEKH